MAAKPVLWKGRVAKVAVVAVPFQDRAALAPQLGSLPGRYSRDHGNVVPKFSTGP